ncbi:MAG: hypothetical protein R3F59_37185 [Myxococcota bacterium]
MGGRSAAVAGATVLWWALGCAGGAPEATDDPAVAPEPGSPPVKPGMVPVPAAASLLVPEGISASRVEAGTDPLVVHLVLRSLQPLEAWWTEHANVAVTGREEQKLIGAWWEAERVRFVIAEQQGDEVVLKVFDTVPAVQTNGPACEGDLLPVTAGWPDGGAVETCVDRHGAGRPVGPVRVQRYGATVLEGAYDEQSQRTGVWTLRADADTIVAQGAFDDGVPIGGWTFTLGDQQRQVLYVDGVPQDLPFAHLSVAGRDGRAWEGAQVEILDADLERGLLALAVRFDLAPDPATGTAGRDCPALGRVDPKQGLLLQLLRAGHREPAGEWLVYDATPVGGECTTEEAAAEALAAAHAAFDEAHLAYDHRLPLAAPTAGDDPFGSGGVTVPAGEHSVSFAPIDAPLTLEAQLASPDLLAGSWAGSDEQQVRSAEIAVDGRPFDEIRMRWPGSCEGGAKVLGVVAQEAYAAPVYEVVACSGAGPLIRVGAPLWLGAPPDGAPM